MTVKCEWIEQPSKEYLENVFINRLDLSYSNGINWILLGDESKRNEIPVYINNNRAWVSLLFLNLTADELVILFKFIFESRREIKRISYRITALDPSLVYEYVLQNESKAWLLNLNDTFENVFMRSSARTKYDFRRTKKTLEKKIGHITFRKYVVNNVPFEIVRKYVEFKAHSYELSAEESNPHYYLNSEKLDATDFYVLSGDNGEIIAIQINSEHGNFASLVNMAYNPVFFNDSPGRYLYTLVIEDLIKNGFELLYLGSGNEWYKKLYGAEQFDYWVGDVFNNSQSMKDIAK